MIIIICLNNYIFNYELYKYIYLLCSMYTKKCILSMLLTLFGYISNIFQKPIYLLYRYFFSFRSVVLNGGDTAPLGAFRFLWGAIVLKWALRRWWTFSNEIKKSVGHLQQRWSTFSFDQYRTRHRHISSYSSGSEQSLMIGIIFIFYNFFFTNK